MKLKYTIRFLDYWHLGSGLSAGAKLDSTVVKDEDGLPYLPGKTLKGLVREMALGFDCVFLNSCFGITTDKEDTCYDNEKEEKEGRCYFSNAILNRDTAREIKKHHLQDKLYDVIASTRIGKEDLFKNGRQIEKKDIAVDHSLREIEVVVPLTLEGYIDDIPDDTYADKITQALTRVKRMGLNRNRGLGRCEIKVEETKK